MEVVVATALDDAYTMPTIVMLHSLFETADPETSYNVFVLIPENFQKNNKHRFLELQDRFYGHCIHFVTMGNVFKQEKMSIEHISYPTYYRLLLPDLLPDKKRCIYLDGDLLIRQDLKELFLMDLQGAYVGGVKAPGYQIDEQESNNCCRYLDIPDVKNYINAGVLLMDLDKMRRDGMVQYFLELLKKRQWRSQDQDILNVACYGKIKTIPFRYNYQVIGAFYPEGILNRVYSGRERMTAKEQIAIIHYSNSSVKPWKSLQYQYADIWWKYFRKTSYAQEEEKRKSIIKKQDTIRYEEHLKHMERLRQASYIILFGCYNVSIELLQYMKQDGLCVTCFCDNDEKKQGMIVQGLKVYSLWQCMEKYPGAYYVNTSQKFRKDITEQLIKNGILPIHIIEYQKKERYLERARIPQYGNIYM